MIVLDPSAQRFFEDLCRRFAAGQLGILPTDTLYGLSCAADRREVVSRLFALKHRSKAAAVVPPSIEAAEAMVEPSIRGRLAGLLEGYRGPYTTIWPVAPGGGGFAEELWSGGTVGLRLPDHWITEVAGRCGFPLVTTSANLAGEPPLVDLASLPPALARGLDFFVEAGRLEGPPSQVYDCRVEPPLRLR